jgi:hypothetical protein
MATRSFCIHGHFYQPPREDPITGIIPTEPGASPYKNWNERIHAECYQPNAALGNFKNLSFNIGPTLFSWMASHDPATYRQILAEDQANIKRHGVGNAMAQAYNHTILPLASASDKVIQVVWGIADFKHRYGRKPQGMWLPETAVDWETLEVLAHHDIQFTILAPWQAETNDLDPTEPYRVTLPDGRSIVIFFYQQELSADISFDSEATADAYKFALHSLPHYYNREKERNGEPQLLLLASDGELYGHHKPFRERFLAHLLDGASAEAGFTPTFPALWLKSHPPRKTIKVRDDTSWSCHHGVLRWKDHCACTPLDAGWKVNLRRALDRLAAALDAVYFETVYPYVSKPRVLRERYIQVILGELTAEELISSMADRKLTSDIILRISLLLESQKERQRMFTSCGWFFEDFDRIEPRNNLAYAAQAVRLVRIATGDDLASQFAADLQQVISPRTGLHADQVFNYHLQRTWVLGGNRGKFPGG